VRKQNKTKTLRKPEKEIVQSLMLEQEIFETAALLYPKTLPTLLCVARRVHLW
jgi:hypothetical protein